MICTEHFLKTNSPLQVETPPTQSVGGKGGSTKVVSKILLSRLLLNILLAPTDGQLRLWIDYEVQADLVAAGSQAPQPRQEGGDF